MPIVYPFPPELRKSAYISRAEENRMDVELITTVQFREKYGFEVTSDLQKFQPRLNTAIATTRIGAVMIIVRS